MNWIQRRRWRKRAERLTGTEISDMMFRAAFTAGKFRASMSQIEKHVGPGKRLTDHEAMLHYASLTRQGRE